MAEAVEDDHAHGEIAEGHVLVAHERALLSEEVFGLLVDPSDDAAVAGLDLCDELGDGLLCAGADEAGVEGVDVDARRRR